VRSLAEVAYTQWQRDALQVRDVPEQFSADETEVLSRHFTNTDGPVFALVNLPEEVKGALFARYSRSAKSLRRLFLDEFADDAGAWDGRSTPMGTGPRARALYERAFTGYGDDSVAQLGSAHLACEQASNILTKVLERGRLMSYLEQSTRYVRYDGRRPDGSWRYYVPPELEGSHLERPYRASLDAAFEDYAGLLEAMIGHYSRLFPRTAGEPEAAWRRAVRAKALDTVRGVLPAATLSNLGVYGSGQAYEALLIRMRAHPLAEVRSYSDMMLAELRKVIPSLVARVDMAERGAARSRYLKTNDAELHRLAAELPWLAPCPAQAVSLVDFDPGAEDKLVASALYAYSDRSQAELRAQVADMTQDDKTAVLRAFVGDRRDRRDRPGRALEQPVYSFDVLADYGAFRDMQRHRMLSIEWQDLSPAHGYDLPSALAEAGQEARFHRAMGRSADLYGMLSESGHVLSARYTVALAYKARFKMTMNAREAMHVLELRSSPQGHDSYRRLAQEMHRQIAEVAGHRAIAQMMCFVDHSRSGGRANGADRLNRLSSEVANEARRSAFDRSVRVTSVGQARRLPTSKGKENKKNGRVSPSTTPP
jgi:thymidylate synthase ThyX